MGKKGVLTAVYMEVPLPIHAMFYSSIPTMHLKSKDAGSATKFVGVYVHLME